MVVVVVVVVAMSRSELSPGRKPAISNHISSILWICVLLLTPQKPNPRLPFCALLPRLLPDRIDYPKR